MKTRAAAAWVPRYRRFAGLGLLMAALLPATRAVMEARMETQMRVQFPLLIAAGVLVCDAVPRRWTDVAMQWNEHGLAGLVAVAWTLMLAMVPRLLDLALVDPRVEAVKVAALVGAGIAMRLSWPAAGVLVQAFFLGNVLPMMVVVGTLYQDAPTRVCNAYGLDDQRRLGAELLWLSFGIAMLWLATLVRAGPPAIKAGQT